MLESCWLQICPYYDSRVVINDRKMFIRLATEVDFMNKILAERKICYADVMPCRWLKIVVRV